MRTNYPVDDKYTLHISEHESHDLSSIFDRIREYFGKNMILSDYCIEQEHRHVTCLGYDRYDSGDHENYIIIRVKDNTYIEYEKRRYRTGDVISINTENPNITIGKSYKIEMVIMSRDSIIIIDDNGDEYELHAMFIKE